MSKKGKGVMAALIVIIFALGAFFYLVVCAKANRYKVDLGGSDFCYEGVKSSYRAENTRP